MSLFYYFLFTFSVFSGFYLYNINCISYLCNIILLYFDYKVEDFDIEKLPSKIIMISSHTSIYDFLIGIMFYYAYLHSKYDTYIMMKKDFETMCSPIISFLDKKIKLISVENIGKKNGLTEQISNKLSTKNNYILYIAPEGTRKCTENIKSGYWTIAKNLNVDVVYIGIDFYKKVITLEESRKVMEHWDDEKYEFIKSCKNYIPLYPERCHWTKDYYQDYS
jgi:1-acyl-sn-glycerol-3-phosphate acyltransferase